MANAEEGTMMSACLDWPFTALDYCQVSPQHYLVFRYMEPLIESHKASVRLILAAKASDINSLMGLRKG